MDDTDVGDREQTLDLREEWRTLWAAALWSCLECVANCVAETVKAALRLRKVRISHTVALAHVTAFEYTNAKYLIQRIECKPFTVSANHLSINEENAFMG